MPLKTVTSVEGDMSRFLMKKVMEKVQPVLGGLWRSDRGDVLMEYVLLTVLIIIPMIGGSSILFAPGGDGPTFNDMNGQVSGENFGILGNSFVQLYRMVMSGVSLPLP